MCDIDMCKKIAKDFFTTSIKDFNEAIFITRHLTVKLFEDGLNVLEFTIGCKTRMTEKASCQLKVKRFTNQNPARLITTRWLPIKTYQLDNEALE